VGEEKANFNVFTLACVDVVVILSHSLSSFSFNDVGGA
jgi:hypothetical protein